ncbi:MAG: hypothetical protein LBJ41_03680 [Treponema sp.]|jgi:hypothetical protein|nr:hypothetical protein [Treponema sp.]
MLHSLVYNKEETYRRAQSFKQSVRIETQPSSDVDGNRGNGDGNRSDVDGNRGHGDGNRDDVDGNRGDGDGNRGNGDGNGGNADGNRRNVDDNRDINLDKNIKKMYI